MDHMHSAPRCLIWYSIFLAFGFARIASECSRQSNDLERIIAQAKTNDEYLTGGKGTVTYEDFLVKSQYALPGVPVDKVNGNDRVEADYSFDHEKRYAKFYYHGRGNIPYRETGYDGERMWSSGVILSTDGKRAMQGASYENKFNLYQFEPDKFDPRFMGIRIMDIPIGAYLENACADSAKAWYVIRKPHLLGDETINGIPCKVVSITGEKIDCTLWLAPSLRYRAVKAKLDSDNDVLNFDISYQMLNKNILFPASIELHRFMKGKLFMHRKLTVHPDWQVNIPLPDSIFQMGARQLGWREVKASELQKQMNAIR